MAEILANVGPVLDTFYHSTNLGAVCFDRQLEVEACVPQRSLFDDMLCLGLEKLSSFLLRAYALRQPEKSYLFYLRGNLACCVALLGGPEADPAGAVVSQPFFVGGATQEERNAVFQELCGGAGAPGAEKPDQGPAAPGGAAAGEKADLSGLRAVLQRVPSVSGDRAAACCRVLASLVCAAENGAPPRVVLADSDLSGLPPAEAQVHGPAARSAALHASVSLTGTFSTFDPLGADGFRRFTEAVKNGDVQAVADFCQSWQEAFVAFAGGMQALLRKLLLLCALGACASVEGGAPYAKTMSLAESVFEGLAAAETAPSALRQTQEALMAFARTVAVSHLTAYSKPVRQTLEYIEAHFAEKISLENLAHQAGLSPPYLSHLIRKETGRILSDHLSAVRVEQSKKLLLSTNLSSLEVAKQVGFQYQNHFAATFRRETGLSPTEFRSAARFRDSRRPGDEPFPDAFFSPAIEQLRGLLLFFPGLYDAVRIVDPLSHRAWMLYANGYKAQNGPCYRLWGKKESCSNCVASVSYLQSRVVCGLKTIQGCQSLVIAVPKVFGNSTYVVELIKNVTGAMYAEGEGQDGAAAAKVTERAAKAPDVERFGLYSRQYIDRELPSLLRRCRLEKTPLSILLSLVNSSAAEDDGGGWVVNDTVLRRQAAIVNGAFRHSDWAGRYTGNVVLIVLRGANNEVAQRVAARIQEKLGSYLAGYNKKGLPLSAYCGVATLTDESEDAEALERRAFMDLYARMGEGRKG